MTLDHPVIRRIVERLRAEGFDPASHPKVVETLSSMDDPQHGVAFLVRWGTLMQKIQRGESPVTVRSVTYEGPLVPVGTPEEEAAIETRGSGDLCRAEIEAAREALAAASAALDAAEAHLADLEALVPEDAPEDDGEADGERAPEEDAPEDEDLPEDEDTRALRSVVELSLEEVQFTPLVDTGTRAKVVRLLDVGDVRGAHAILADAVASRVGPLPEPRESTSGDEWKTGGVDA